jgi:amino acid transporter
LTSKRVFVREATGLVRELSAFDALFLNLQGVFAVATSAALSFGFAGFLFPGADMDLAVLIALPLGIVFGLVWALMAIAMPRTGGDYLWVSRTFNPILGFANSFLITIFWGFVLIGGQMIFLTSFGLSVPAAFWGQTFKSTSLSSFSTWIVSPFGSTAVGSVVIVLDCLLAMFSFRIMSKILRAFFLISLIGTPIVYCVQLLLSTHQGFVSAFNSYAAAQGLKVTYQGVIEAAKSAGATLPPISLAASVSAVGLTWFFYSGTFSPYVAGEMKNVKSTMIPTVIGAYLIAAISMIAIGVLSYNVYGYDFVSAASYLFYSGASSNPIPIPPTVFYLISILNPNPLFVGFMSISLILNVLLLNICSILVVTRITFAWAFDRVVPTKIAAVSDRLHAPYVSPIIAMIGGIVSLWAFNYTGLFSFWINPTIGFTIGFIIVAIAAAIFPFKQRSIFEASPKPANMKIGGVPLITILGVACAIVLGWATYLGYIIPALSGPTSTQALVATVLGTFIIGMVIYEASLLYNKSKGIDLALAFKQIPPE